MNLSLQALCSIAITVLMVGGVWLRGKPKLHIPMMWVVILSDVALLLWVELQAHAIKRVAGAEIPWWLWVHVAIATTLIVGYVVAIVLGLKLRKNPGNQRVRAWHKRNGLSVVLLRFGLLGTTPGLLLPALGHAAAEVLP